MMRNLILALLGAMLLWLAWPPLHLPYLLFVGFLPLLIIEDSFVKTPQRYGTAKLMALAYLHFLGWNLLCTWWVCLASVGGGISANLANSLLMCLPLLAYHKIRLQYTKAWVRWCIVPLWLGFEYFHLRWDLSWPWLTLGNGFASEPWLVQWYEYTGHLGGSVWIWVINLLVMHTVTTQKQMLRKISVVATALFLPVIFSVYLQYSNTFIKNSGPSVVVIQPNIDPYNEKFNGLTATEQLDKMLALAEQKMSGNEQLLVLPETALTDNVEEEQIEHSQGVKTIRDFMQQHPGLSVLTGANTYKVFYPGQPHPLTARDAGDGRTFIDYYNTALLISPGQPVQYYYKSRLVPGAEKMPYPQLFGFLENFAIDLGGVSGSLGMQATSEVFTCPKNLVVAPIICYESVYGEYVSSYVQKGANLLCIITNDGWWQNTDGYKQHLMYASLRAIETRRWIARSANTGISCFVSPTGKLQRQTEWWQPAVIQATIPLNQQQTIYTRFGDYLGLGSLILSLATLLSLLFKKIISRRTA